MFAAMPDAQFFNDLALDNIFEGLYGVRVVRLWLRGPSPSASRPPKPRRDRAPLPIAIARYRKPKEIP